MSNPTNIAWTTTLTHLNDIYHLATLTYEACCQDHQRLTPRICAPAPIIEVFLGDQKVRVSCPVGCPGGHIHSWHTGPREPHCTNPTGGGYVVVDPDGLLDTDDTKAAKAAVEAEHVRRHNARRTALNDAPF